MAEGAVQSLGNIAGGLIWQIVIAIGIIVFSVGLFYLIRFIQKGTKKQKSFVIRAIILDLNGVIEFDMLAFVKSEASGLLEMIFKNRKNRFNTPNSKAFNKKWKSFTFKLCTRTLLCNRYFQKQCGILIIKFGK